MKSPITLATLHLATEQEVFDQVVTHLRKQGVQSVNDPSRNYSGCAYRGAGGLKCAAGCLIADEEYSPDMDNANNTGWTYLTDTGIFPNHHTRLIASLQRVHDGWHGAWEINFQQVAHQYNLTLKAA